LREIGQRYGVVNCGLELAECVGDVVGLWGRRDRVANCLQEWSQKGHLIFQHLWMSAAWVRHKWWRSDTLQKCTPQLDGWITAT